MNTKISLLTVLLASALYSSAQSTTTTTTVPGKKLNFSEVKVDGEGKTEYKTLEIRYMHFDDTNMSSTVVDGVIYKCFKEKKYAISHYMSVKNESPSLVIYYVNSEEVKKPEVFTFRME